MKIRTHDIVLDKVGESIVKGVLKPLERLPSDTELCRQYQIGRNTLREVFKVLTTKGLIGASPRKGTWVNEPDDWDIFDPEVLRWSEGTPLYTKVLLDVTEARLLVEPAAARLAARHAKISDIAAIEDAYERMQGATPGTNAACRADVDFHVALFHASHNKLWIKFGQALSYTLTQLFKTNVLQDRYYDELPLHGQILQAIRFQDEETAEASMRQLTHRTAETLASIVKNHYTYSAA